MDKKINVNVNNNGKVYVETEDFKGESCVSAIKELFAEILEIDDFDYKPEFYEEEEIIDCEVNIGR